jgi:hypothetical protein
MTSSTECPSLRGAREVSSRASGTINSNYDEELEVPAVGGADSVSGDGDEDEDDGDDADADDDCQLLKTVKKAQRPERRTRRRPQRTGERQDRVNHFMKDVLGCKTITIKKRQF